MFRKACLLTLFVLFILGSSLPAMADGQLVWFLAGGIYHPTYGALEGGKIYTYTAGTTSTKDLYTDVELTTTASNPVILDSNGRAVVYGDGLYKFVIKDAYDTTIVTIDDIEIRSIESMLSDPSDPFGSTFYQTNFIASSVTTIDLAVTDGAFSGDVSVTGDLSVNATATLSALSATLTADLDANGYRIVNLPAASDPTDAVRLSDLSSEIGGAGISSQTMAVYLTPGNATWTCPAGITSVYVSLIGGGGGGGGRGDNGNYAGEAGEPGEAIMFKQHTVTPATAYSITVGSYGSAGSNGAAGSAGGAGGTGGDTIFDTLTAQGGRGGRPASSTADCISGIGCSLSRTKGTPFGVHALGVSATTYTDIYGVGGTGGHIATYTDGFVYGFNSTAGAGGAVVIQW